MLRRVLLVLLLCAAQKPAEAKPLPAVKLPPASATLPDLWVATPAGWTDLVVDSIRYSDDLRMPASLNVSGRSSTRPRADQWVGQPITVAVRLGKEFRYWNGIVDEVGIAREQGDAALSLEIRSWPWMLRRVSNVRAFENKSVPEVLEAVLGAHDYAKFDFRLKDKYPKRPLIVQYRETDLNMLSRSLEDAGIHMLTEHTQKHHKMIFTDSQPQKSSVTLSAATREGPGSVQDWRRSESVPISRYALRNTNGFDVSTGDAKQKSPFELEMYDFEQSDGGKEGLERQSRVRLEENVMSTVKVAAMSEDHRLSAGVVFELKGHPSDDGNYLVTQTTQTYMGEPGQPVAVRTHFEAVPNENRYRPGRFTAEPMIAGVQLAEVRELSADKPEQVRVWFRWDRGKEAKSKGSAWIAVSPKFASGQKKSPLSVGDWVVIAFAEGDADLPFVVAAAQAPAR